MSEQPVRRIGDHNPRQKVMHPIVGPQRQTERNPNGTKILERKRLPSMRHQERTKTLQDEPHRKQTMRIPGERTISTKMSYLGERSPSPPWRSQESALNSPKMTNPTAAMHEAIVSYPEIKSPVQKLPSLGVRKISKPSSFQRP
jgi:hypothetical protein